MTEQRLLTGPAAGLFAGIVLAVIWVVVLSYIYELTNLTILLLLTAGAMGAVGASSATLVMSAASRREQSRLDEAEHQARHDPLTGLTNRAELFNQLDHSLTYAAENDLVLGVLFLDLDRFKNINDSLGHEVGDELLRIVADRLKSTVRNTDVVARLGGDEFVVLCRGLMLGDSVVATAKQILKAFKEPISLNGKAHVVSTSIGVAIASPGDERVADSLVSDADAAMYRAKRAKSGFAVFDEAHRQMVADRLDIERALVHAIESGQIVVYYQPIVDATSHALYGFEALVRWHHPEKGMIPPGEFLNIAEEAGMMGQIGTLVLRESCAQMAVWNHASPEARRIRVGVNLSEQQLTDDSLPALVSETLAWTGVDPQQLVLEITEDVIVEHLDGLAILRQLRDLGVSLSIDDFGTGQSSLSYVKQFDMVSTLKIDQSFVRDMESANADRAIIEAVVAMATALELKIVAEGVEYASQLAKLRDLGVTLIQGYLFGKPMPADEIDPHHMFTSQPMPFKTSEPVSAGAPAPKPEFSVPARLLGNAPSQPGGDDRRSAPVARPNPAAPAQGSGLAAAVSSPSQPDVSSAAPQPVGRTQQPPDSLQPAQPIGSGSPTAARPPQQGPTPAAGAQSVARSSARQGSVPDATQPFTPTFTSGGRAAPAPAGPPPTSAPEGRRQDDRVVRGPHDAGPPPEPARSVNGPVPAQLDGRAAPDDATPRPDRRSGPLSERVEAAAAQVAQAQSAGPTPAPADQVGDA